MKTIFIVNPEAGQGKKFKKLIDSINSVSKKLESDVEVYITKAIGDAERFVRKYCEKKQTCRFIACGGDGTFNEVLNGAIDCKTAEIGTIPIGTGNDFTRNFNDECDFEDIKLQITGNSIECDAIKYSTYLNGSVKSGYCANMFNIGFDCNVADMTANIKKKWFVSGSIAYMLSALISLIKKKGANLKIEVDGVVRHDGELLLTSVANGGYCGGGFNSNPLATINDGMININIVKNVTRRRFLSLLPHYKKGTFLKLRDIDKVVISEKCQNVTITPEKNVIRLCNDGEISDAGKTVFEIVHNAFKFVVPSVKVKELEKV